MNIYEFLITVGEVRNEHPELRYGQALFNTLVNERPELARKVQGTTMDPFHAYNPEDERVRACLRFLYENWDREPE